MISENDVRSDGRRYALYDGYLSILDGVRRSGGGLGTQ